MTIVRAHRRRGTKGVRRHRRRLRRGQKVNIFGFQHTVSDVVGDRVYTNRRGMGRIFLVKRKEVQKIDKYTIK